jgi:hypothetical protein
MNVNGFTQRQGWPNAILTLSSALLGLGVIDCRPAGAATIRRFVLPSGEAPVFRAWTNYLSAGPQVWSRTKAPAFTPGIRGTIWAVLKSDTQAQSLANPMIDYLLWRRSLKPERFDANHPRLGPTLNQLLSFSPTPVITPPVTTPLPAYSPVPQSTPTSTSPQIVTPPPVVITPPEPAAPTPIPEPSSVLLATGMLGWGIWWRRRMNRPARRR